MHSGANRGAEGWKGASRGRSKGMAGFDGAGRKGRLGVNINNIDLMLGDKTDMVLGYESLEMDWISGGKEHSVLDRTSGEEANSILDRTSGDKDNSVLCGTSRGRRGL